MAPPSIALFLAAYLAVPAAGHRVAVSDEAALRRALSAPRPGTTILVAPGEYRGPFGAAGIHGTAEQPITLAAADPERPPVFRGGKECLHFSAVSHLILRDLVLVGASLNGLNIDAGGGTAPSHHIILGGLTVRGITEDGNRDGIKLTWVDDLLAHRCTVERWGSGGSAIDLVGCRRAIIADCQFRHTEGRGATGVQIKGGSRRVIVYRSRFHSAGQRAINLGGCTQLGHFRDETPTSEASELAAVGNVFTGSKAALTFVGSQDCTAAYNTIVRPTAWVLRILKEGRRPQFLPCRGGSFRGNLVVWRWRELRTVADIRSRTEPGTFRFDGNWWYCADRPAESHPTLPVPDAAAVVGRDPGLILDGPQPSARSAPSHGAHAPGAARLFAVLATQRAPWAFQVFRSMTPTRPSSPQPPKGATE